jgi:branched-chain amino acid transport system substrate-binding protein
MTRRHWTALTGAALAAAWLGAAPAWGADPIPVGLAVSLTTDFALVGLSQQNGAVMAVEEINKAGGVKGRPIRLVSEDTANSNTVAVNALHRILREKPVAVLGPVWGTQNLAMEPVIREARVSLISPTGTRKVTQLGNKYVFRFFTHDGIAKAGQARFAVEKLGARKPAILTVNDEYGISGRDIMTQALAGLGVKPVAVEAMATGDKDVTAQLRNIQRSGADALLTQIHPAPIAIVVKQARQLGLAIPHVASNALILPSTLGLVEGPDVDGVYVETVIVPSVDPNPKIQDWLRRYQARFGKAGDHFALLQYDITHLLARVLEEAGPEPTPDGIQQRLRAVRHEGLVTLYESDDEGNLNHLVSIYRLDAGKRPELKDRFRLDPRK